MKDATKKSPAAGAPQRRTYTKPGVRDEEVFERQTLLGASGVCNGDIGVCGTPAHPGTIASQLGN